MATPDRPNPLKYVAYRHKDESVSVFTLIEHTPYHHKMKVRTLFSLVEFEIDCHPHSYKICDTQEEAVAIMTKAQQIWEYINKKEKQRDNLFSKE